MSASIRDRYEPTAVVGRGGQGEVLRAMDRLHDRAVALKVRIVGEPAEREYILSEARILLGLRPHSGLPLVREDFFEDDRYYLVMDWIEGRSLREALAERNGIGIEVDEALDALAQVAEALDHLHAHDPPIVHGDVKPANIIVTPEGRTVLVDFGIAGAAGGGVIGGTPGYVAPELASGERPGIASDVFGLAATAFALLTGAPPRPGKRPRWRGVTKEQARRLDMALMRGLALDPARRPSTAGALVAAMRGEAAAPTNLPVELTTFIGREALRAEVERLIRAARLVTITGPAGIGKTRLALAVAAELLPSFPDGAWVVELAPLGDASLVPHAVAAALAVRETPGTDVAGAVADHLSTRRALVVLDNCEHLVDACAALARRLLRASPQTRFVATSREPLGIDGETTWRLPPLELPEEKAPLETLAQAESVRLFVERARLIDPAFEAKDETLASVARLCRRLEGIPLAIELAAARTNLLGVAQIDARLDDRLRLLEGSRRRGGPARQASLRAAIDWSYELLDDAEKEALNRLGCFAGGFTLEAAEAICAAEEAGGLHVLELVSALVDKSLVIRDDVGLATRYRMLESIRAYAGERLTASGAEGVRARHLAWFAGLARRAAEALEGPDQKTWLEAIAQEHDNVRAAIAFGLQTGAEDALELATSLWRFWDVRGYFSEGRSWIEQALAAVPGASAEARARGLRALGDIVLDQGDYATATSLLTEGLTLARDAGDRETAASCLNALANVAGLQGHLGEEKTLHEQCLAIWREIGNRRGTAVTLGNLGTVALDEGDHASARDLFTESLAIRREVGDRRGIAVSLNGLALASGALGDRAAERRLFEESLTIWRELGSRSGEAVALTNLGTVARAEGDLAAARSLLDEAVAAHRETGQRWNLADSLYELAEVLRADGDVAAAAAPHLEALTIRREIGDDRGTADSITGLAGLAIAAGEAERAARLLGAAEAMRAQTGASISPKHLATYEADHALLATAMEPDAFEAAWKAGVALSPDEAAAVAAKAAGAAGESR